MQAEPIRQKLIARKGKWPQLARLAQLDYSVVVRFANGKTVLPELRTLLKLNKAMKDLPQ